VWIASVIALSAPWTSVDHRGPFAVVAHPGHQVPEPGATPGREVVTRVPKIMEVQAWQADQGGGASAAARFRSRRALALGGPPAAAAWAG
jgi:hypothetical protein